MDGSGEVGIAEVAAIMGLQAQFLSRGQEMSKDSMTEQHQIITAIMFSLNSILDLCQTV